ncbi:hypothetical protein [Fulvivirga sp.]|uniref:hypothetical protein n=1 Tax=Fulvivirga sp. TaxID=1931237 RepID=UPI0032EF8595
MEFKTDTSQAILEKVEQFSLDSIALLKLKSVDKTGEITSNIVASLVLLLAILFFTLILSIAVSFWLGDLLGKVYYGFLIVTSFYAIIVVILFLSQSWIKAHVNNSIINRMLS